MATYFNIHNHTMYSNIRLLDCINRPKDLIDKAIELGLSGIAITDHECLSGHMEVNQYAKKIKETHPDFKIVLGNEVYLVDKRENGIKYYHFILTAKDALGHKALRELSSTAWYNSYFDRGMEHVPITKEELANIMLKYKGHVVASTACMGGELSTAAYNMSCAEAVGDMNSAYVFHEQICNFIDYCQKVFGEDFYIECAPSTAEDQCVTNRKLYRIAQAYNIPIIVGTDSHYLTKNDRFVHKSYLNSKGGEREVDSFYEFAHLMTYEEAYELLEKCFGDGIIATQILNNSDKLKEKFSDYSLERKQMVPKVEVPTYSAWDIWDMVPGLIMDNFDHRWLTLQHLVQKGNDQERYWVMECLKSLWDKGLQNKQEYWDILETEAEVIKDIGEKLDDCLFAYFNTFKHYIDLFWECGSIVGPGRGSATGFLSNYLLGITQLDPIRWNLPYWRFLNKERAELPSLLLILGSCKKRTLTVA